jgi:hypothetical protein
MNPFESLFSGIMSGVTKAAGSAAAKAVAGNPTVQGALTDAQAQLDQAKKAATVAAVVAGAVVLFYFIPRFENPIPRIFRKGRK